MTISVSRRAVLKGTGAGFAASLFMHRAPTLAAETQAHSGNSEWTLKVVQNRHDTQVKMTF